MMIDTPTSVIMTLPRIL